MDREDGFSVGCFWRGVTDNRHCLSVCLQAKITVPRDAYMMDFVFSDVEEGEGTYDNRGGFDYHLPVEGSVVRLDISVPPSLALTTTCRWGVLWHDSICLSNHFWPFVESLSSGAAWCSWICPSNHLENHLLSGAAWCSPCPLVYGAAMRSVRPGFCIHQRTTFAWLDACRP
jgi:Starch/carbohydrate-binding module (family 53)